MPVPDSWSERAPKPTLVAVTPSAHSFLLNCESDERQPSSRGSLTLLGHLNPKPCDVPVLASAPDGRGGCMVSYERVVGATSEWSANRVVVLDPAGSVLTTLNETGSVVWDRLRTPASAEEIAAALAERYPEIEPQRLRTDARAFIVELVEAGLIVASDAKG